MNRSSWSTVVLQRTSDIKYNYLVTERIFDLTLLYVKNIHLIETPIGVQIFFLKVNKMEVNREKILDLLTRTGQ